MKIVAVLGIALLVGILTHLPSSHSQTKPSQKVEASVIKAAIPTQKPTATLTPTKIVYPTNTPAPTPTITFQTNSGLSNDNYYINSSGNEVHSPAYANSVPAGATAICGDGTYSFSQSRRGTCSHHGGVAQWL